MKKLLLCTGFLLCAAAMCAAQSNNEDFKGFYVGGYAGGVKGTSNTYTSTIFSPTGYFAMSSIPAIAAAGNQPLSPRGFTGGGTVGYNFQHHHWVLGFEGDFGSMHEKDDAVTTLTYPCCAPTALTIKQTVTTDWLLTARPRVGVTSHGFMVYGTVGLAMTNLDYTGNFLDTFAAAHESASTSGVQTGWTGGGGVELKLGSSGHWSMKGEYLYSDFGSGLKVTSTNMGATFGTTSINFPTNVFTHQADLTTNTFRMGFNYHF